MDEVRVRLQCLRHVVAASRELHRVDALAAQVAPQAIAHSDSQRHREDHGVVEGHLEDHDDRRERRAGGSGDHARHPGEGDGRRHDVQAREEGAKRHSERCPERRVHEERGREDAARSSGSEGQRRREKLGREEHQEQTAAVEIPRQNIEDRRISDALDVIVTRDAHEAGGQDADPEHSDHVTEVFSLWGRLFEEVLGGIERADEEGRDHRHEATEDEVRGQESDGRGDGHAERGDLEGGMAAEQEAPDVGRGGQGHRNERPHADFVDEDFDGEEEASDRGIERRGDACAPAGRDGRRELPSRGPRGATRRRRERRPDLDDGSFSPDGATAPDREGRSERLDRRDDGRMTPFL
jgi:hypothetical protein